MKQTIPRGGGDRKPGHHFSVQLLREYITSPLLGQELSACLKAVALLPAWHLPVADLMYVARGSQTPTFSARLIEKSYSLMFPCVTGEFVPCGPTEVSTV